METTIEVKCFPGFYETIFSEIYIEESQQESLRDSFPDFKHLHEWEIDSERYRKAVAQRFAEIYVDELNNKLQLNIKLISNYIQNPYEYNFATNTIICTIEVGDYGAFIDSIIKLINEPQYYPQLAKIIKERHSDAPGFWSFMSNDIKEWHIYLADPDNTNYLECILWYLYCLKAQVSLDDCGIADCIYEELLCNTDVMCLVPMTDAAREEHQQWVSSQECE